MTPIRLLLADDHTLFRTGLRRILDEHSGFEVVAEAASGIEAVEMARAHQPQVAIVDIGMKELNGVEATAQILRQSPRTAVLILSMHSDERYVIRAVRNGARGYMLKDTVEENLLRAIRDVSEGKRYFSPELEPAISRGFLQSEEIGFDDRYELLTERERQLYQMLAEGMANKDIAARLNLSVHTVETHRTRIMEKLGVHTIAELVLSAVRRGLVR